MSRYGTLIVILDKARNLPNRRKIGKQSCYAVVRLGNDCQRSPTDKRAGQVPSWNHEMRFSVACPEETLLRISIFNEDSRTPDLVADAAVDLTSLYQKREYDAWVPLRFKDKPAGEVYVELTFYYEGPPKVKGKHPDSGTTSVDGRGQLMAPAPVPQHRLEAQGWSDKRRSFDGLIGPRELQDRRRSMPAFPQAVEMSLAQHRASPSPRGPRAEGMRSYEPETLREVEPLLDPRHGTFSDPSPQVVSARLPPNVGDAARPHGRYRVPSPSRHGHHMSFSHVEQRQSHTWRDDHVHAKTLSLSGQDASPRRLAALGDLRSPKGIEENPTMRPAGTLRPETYAPTPDEYERHHRPLPPAPDAPPSRPPKIPLGLTREEYAQLYA
ncbi:hypothetical protein PYCC9005_005880 [Savitreella phatthalungensis]